MPPSGPRARDDPDGRFIRGVDSETDDYPVGDVRLRWEPKALEELDLKLENYLSRVSAKATHAEVEQIMAKPDITTALGLRDRAVLETSAVRRAELVSLKVEDIDLTQGLLYVRQGKGGKDRVVPLGERAIAWLRKYIEDAREKLLDDPSEQTLFLTRYGDGFNTGSLARLVRAYLDGTVGSGRGADSA